jgi:hypothetical protein
MSSQEYEPAEYDDTYYFDDGRPICWRHRLKHFFRHWSLWNILMIMIVVTVVMYLYYNRQTLLPQIFKGGTYGTPYLRGFELIEIE